MIQNPKFNPVTDIEECVPDLSVSLTDAIKTHVVLDTGVEPMYNDIEDPSLCSGIVRDAFEAIDLQRKLGKAYAAAKAAEAKASEAKPDTSGAQS